MSDITPFKIEIPVEQLTDLKLRLAMTRMPDTETPNDWSQGVPLAYMSEVKDYWEKSYHWPDRQALLNRWPGFKTTLSDVDIHFLHIQSKHDQARPLLMTHGWPGSIVEFQKVIEALTDPVAHGGTAEQAFHLVCPSLPGFGFSGQPTQPGWGIEKIAEAWDELMLRLGYPQYLAQGGDWGAIVTTAIGVQNLGHCQGIHVTMPIVTPNPETMDDLTDAERDSLAAMQFYQNHDSGYSKQQSTRPQTLGYGLADSPMGQAAWILEKFYQWMDCDGLPQNVVSLDELLDNVMLYWLPNAGASSARIYWESFGSSTLSSLPVTVPSAISIFPKEIFKTSERWARQRYQDLRYFNQLPKGGHFAAFEQPDLFVKELRAAFDQMGD
ncbi:MAG: epoxide hydrolase [Gammaproteobacteria bacterium]|jgi:pimeloyl-ACP methyl ester carboxylesterase|nr:epoxide hydrolase [Gammaproteobacteria bacterium]MBT5052680.1 epoxide hydrolase [Gammaproteobacteria bacterium]